MADEQVQEHGEVREERLDPEREARRRVALAQIRQYPDPVLRMRANEVESFDDDLRRLVERMIALMQEANGVGLAGTQVGTLQRVFVVQPTPEDEPRGLVNPMLAGQSEERTTDDEGCLSLQGVTIPVERALRVTVEAKDPRGEDVRLEFEEHAARVAQHELDHLDGILIIDRTTPEARREALGILRPEPLLGPIA
jgi:peptide deformylase